MRTFFFPFKKIRRNCKYLLFGAVLMTAVLAAYLEFVATTNTWNDNIQSSPWNELNLYKHEGQRAAGRAQGKGRPWEAGFVQQLWRPEYKGQANLHIFEDWCGSSIAQLRKNLHYPLYPHSRTVVKKLAVTPRWTNYGLRIFGYLHPHTDGKYLFALASDDNSEFWLSSDESPLNCRLLALVGKSGKEWTAPGEFGKYASQTSHAVELKSSRRYYFEIIHKQNDQGTDHVELAWQMQPGGLRFSVIGPQHISLYTNESGLLMSEVAHIPQTVASHTRLPGDAAESSTHGADMLREDRRDSLHQLPLIDESYLNKLLPDCTYQPSYIIKGFPLLRYQGLQFVYMSYIYPNDYTRLTHMETENKCFYHASPQYIDRYGFYRYMKLDAPDGYQERQSPWENRGFEETEDDIQYQDLPEEDHDGEDNAVGPPERSNNIPDYGDDYDDYTFKRKRKLFAVPFMDKPSLGKNRKRSDFAKVQEGVPARVPDQEEKVQREDPEVKVQRTRRHKQKTKMGTNEGLLDPPKNSFLAPENNELQSEQVWRGNRGMPGQAREINAAQVERHLVVRGPNDKVVALEKLSGVKNRTFHHVPKRIKLPAAEVLVPSQAPLVPLENHPSLLLKANSTTPQAEIRNEAIKRDKDPNNRWQDIKGSKVQERVGPVWDNAVRHVQDPPHPQESYQTRGGAVEKVGTMHDNVGLGPPLPRRPHESRRGEEKREGPGLDIAVRHIQDPPLLKNANGPKRGEEKRARPELDKAVHHILDPPLLKNANGPRRGEEERAGPELDNEVRHILDPPLLKKANGPKRGEDERAGPELDNEVRHILDPPPLKRAHRSRVEEAEERAESVRETGNSDRKMDMGGMWKQEEDAEEDYDEDGLRFEATEPVPFDPEVKWGQTFEVDPLDFHSLRSDWMDLSCNVSGNLLLKPEDAMSIVERFMKKLNQKHPGRFSLLQVVNVEKRVDPSYGSRYLLELELLERGGARVRLSRYVYLLQRRGRPRELVQGRARPDMVLCDPRGFAWNPHATVHFIVPVKNQARWVRQFILDMEELYRDTGDRNFNIIITDYSSTDMDVEQELRGSTLPRYQYVKLSGNFERSAGLQAGIDLITEDHSIVFLCDLHIHFPSSIIDSIRKHCVEGKMAFAPIVLRLNCGATPREPNGFWEVNGFGLLGIYKSDLDAAGGMNTREFRDRWGGEDWELLDRILQAGLEVERIYLRNFMHHFHSKRGMWNRQPMKAT